jgi:hypothetical protein
VSTSTGSRRSPSCNPESELPADVAAGWRS